MQRVASLFQQAFPTSVGEIEDRVMMLTTLEEARRKPDSLKGRILRVARQIFAQRGYHGASTRSIAKEVGIDVSTLYYHWGSKRNLFNGILQDLQIDFEDRIRTWVLESRDLPLEQCFDRGVDLLGPFFLNKDVVRVVMFSFFEEDFAGRGWAIRSQKQLILTFRTFVEKRFGAKLITAEFDASVLSFIASTLVLVGSRNYLAAVLDIDPESGQYKELVIQTLRRSLGAFLMSFANGEGCADGGPQSTA
jgi:TetR/AcrR family transcriptional regulator, regulator of cefoperazone and chloramphenicol sensitivity